MQLAIGTYQFQVNQVSVQSLRTLVRAETRRPIRYYDRITARGVLIGSSQADLSNQENQLRAVLATPFLNVILFNDNSSVSGTALINSNTLSGITIADGPHFKESRSPEYVNQRTFEFTAEAFTLAPNAGNYIVSFQEKVEVIGNGGPRYLWRYPIQGDPVLQQLTETTPVVTRQSGRAIGHLSYPSIPDPIFGTDPGYYVNEKESTDYDSPTGFGETWINWPVSWSYEWNSPLVLSGTPNLPPL
jgi:hypothetical protein